MTNRFLKLFTIYGRGFHLGHATLGIYTNFRSQFRRSRNLSLIGKVVSETIFLKKVDRWMDAVSMGVL